MRPPPALVAFDVDGTLLRGDTVCVCLARHVGKFDEMSAFERLSSQHDIAAARREMLRWYKQHDMEALLACLRSGLNLAPGAKAGLARLRSHGVKTALVSITWSFAVEWLARELDADFWTGTSLHDSGEILDFWPEDKAEWLRKMSGELGIAREAMIAVGDSAGDVPMLSFAGRGYFVGPVAPALPDHVSHWPEADIAELVEDMIGATASRAKSVSRP